MSTIETTVPSASALFTMVGLPVLAGIAATSLTFLFMWPRTRREALVRFTCSIFTAALLGPLLVVALHSWWPSLFDSARIIAVMYGGEPAWGVLAVVCPVMVLSGLPAWWVIGAIVLWLEHRRDKDFGELVHDALEIAKQVRESR